MKFHAAALTALVAATSTVTAMPHAAGSASSATLARRNVAGDRFASASNREDLEAPLDELFEEIESIPDSILEKGQEALDAWLVEHGLRDADAELTPVDDAVEARALLAARETTDVRLAERQLWDIAKCAASIAELIVTTAIPVAKIARIKRYIEALGGVREAAGLLIGATTRAEKLRVGGEALVALSAELLGISLVQENCPL